MHEHSLEHSLKFLAKLIFHTYASLVIAVKFLYGFWTWTIAFGQWTQFNFFWIVRLPVLTKINQPIIKLIN